LKFIQKKKKLLENNICKLKRENNFFFFLLTWQRITFISTPIIWYKTFSLDREKSSKSFLIELGNVREGIARRIRNTQQFARKKKFFPPLIYCKIKAEITKLVQCLAGEMNETVIETLDFHEHTLSIYCVLFLKYL
jgi:hypothetical protein